jgi:hypothetical protein
MSQWFERGELPSMWIGPLQLARGVNTEKKIIIYIFLFLLELGPCSLPLD